MCLLPYEDVHQDCEEFDSTWQTALHHACNHSSWCKRICYAALDLAYRSSVEVINMPSYHFAKWITPLLFLCDVAGPMANYRCRIAKVLINRGANTEAKDQHGNTAFLLAAAAGFVSMLELLYYENADIHATNDAGAGALARCAACSSTTVNYLRSIGVLSTRRNGPPTAVRGRSNGASQKVRQVRKEACHAGERSHHIFQ